MNLSRTVPISSIYTDRTLDPDDDVSKLAQSINDSGLQIPILVGQDLRLIDGLRRMEAVLSLGQTVIPVNAVTLVLPAMAHIKRTREHGVEAIEMTPRRIWRLYKAVKPLMNLSRSQRMRNGNFGKSVYIGGRKEFVDAVGIDSESYLQACNQLYNLAEENSSAGELARELVALVDAKQLTVYMALNRITNQRRRGDIVSPTEQLAALQTAARTLSGVGFGLTRLGTIDSSIDPQQLNDILADFRLFRRRFIQLIHKIEKEANLHE